MAFNQSRLWWFAICSCKPIAGGHTPISHAACCGTLTSFRPKTINGLNRKSMQLLQMMPNSLLKKSFNPAFPKGAAGAKLEQR